MSYFVDKFGDTYKVIRNYISKDEAIKMGEDYRKFVLTDGIPTREQVTNNAYDYYNRPDQVALLSEKVSEVNKIYDRKVIPSFSYIRQYECGSSLDKHSDRKSCEVAFSIHLYGDKEWAFCIEDKDNNPVEVILQPGDAVTYDANNAQHWRNEYTGEFYIQSFQFYVLLGGDSESSIFDNNHECLSVTSYIKQYKDKVDSVACENIIKYAEDRSDRWTAAFALSPNSGEHKRICDIWEVDPGDEIDDLIFNCIKDSVSDYGSLFPYMRSQQDNGYSILRYVTGDEHHYHTDQNAENNRELSIIVNLNDDYEGGALNLHNEYVSTKMDRGDIMIFPSNFMFPYRINPITSGVRYTIVTWMS